MTSTLQELYQKNWYETKGKTDKRPLNEAISHIGSDTFIVAYELTKNSRAFATFENLEEFLDTYDKLPEEHPKTYYEIMNNRHNMYFDLDFNLSNFKLKNMINSFVNLLATVYLREFKQDLKKSSIFILNASDNIKGSLHFIIRGKLFRNEAEAKYFTDELYGVRNTAEFDYVDENGNTKSAIDLNLYKKNQQYRIIGSNKYGSTRTLKPISINGNHLKKYDPKNYFASYCDGDEYYYEEGDIEPNQNLTLPTIETEGNPNIKKALKLFSEQTDSVNHNLSSYTVEEHKDGNLEISFKRLSSSQCELCEKTHDKDNTALLLVCINDNKVFLKCYKPYNKGKSQFIGNLTEEAETISNEDEDEMTFIQKAIQQATEKSQAILEAQIEKKFKKTGANVIRYNNKYCSNNEAILNSEAVIIGQRASMGTGKTNAVARRAVMRYSSKEQRYIVVSFRISLSDQLKNDKFSADPT